MRGARSKRRVPFASAAGTAGLVLACQAVLGIEDLSELPRPLTPAAGNGGSTDVAGSGGGAGAPAGGAGGSTAGAPALGGSTSGGAPGVVPNGGDAGPLTPDAGPTEPGTITVAGRVIDFFGRPVPGIPISVGGQPPIATGARGEFSVAGVEPPYDVVLTLNMVRTNLPARYGYVFEGLTRADPTLHLYSALPQRETSFFNVTIANGDFDLDASRRVILAFSSPDGRFVTDVTGDTSFVGGINWTGPANTSGNVHALRVIGSDSFGGSPPVAYEAYQTVPLIAQSDVVAAVTLDMQARVIATANLAGTVGDGPLGERSNYVSLRFADGAALPLLDDTALDGAFDYLVPALGDTSLVFAAADGIGGIPPYAVAWRDGLAPGANDIELDIPSPVTLGAPSFGAVVGPGTTFSWSNVGLSAKTFVWHLESTDLFIPLYEGIFVITARTSIELPEFFDFAVSSGAQVEWSVETHGDAPDVDALAGPEGFLDPFSVNEAYPAGPRRGGGYFTESARNAASMSP